MAENTKPAGQSTPSTILHVIAHPLLYLFFFIFYITEMMLI